MNPPSYCPSFSRSCLRTIGNMPKCNYLSCLLCFLWSVTCILDFNALFWIFCCCAVPCCFCFVLFGFPWPSWPWRNIHHVLMMPLGLLYVIVLSHDCTRVVCLGESVLELDYPSHHITSRMCDNHTIPMMLKLNYLGMSIFAWFLQSTVITSLLWKQILRPPDS